MHSAGNTPGVRTPGDNTTVMVNRVLIILAITLVTHTSAPEKAASQTVPDEAEEFAMEKVSEETDTGPDFQEAELQRELAGGGSLDLNKASAADLLSLPFITPRQTEALMSYIRTYGSLLSVYELRSVPGFDTATIRKLLPFIMTGPEARGPRLTMPNLIQYGRHELAFRYQQVLQQKEGYRSHIYLGSPQKYVFRYVFTFSDKIRAGLAGEKDAGEQFFGPSQPVGMDFWSGYLSVTNMGILRSLVIGNFTAGFGQGLVFSSGSRLGSVIGFGTALRTGQGVRGCTSMNETGFLRGIGATLRKDRLSLSLFFSRQKRDAVVVEAGSLSSEPYTVSSVGGTGYHRTASEIEEKGKVTEMVYGGNVSFTGNFFRIGVTGSRVNRNAVLSPQPALYNQFTFPDPSLTNIGADMIVRLKAVSIYAEMGKSIDGGWAWTAGIQAETAQNLSISLSVRDYARNYYNPWSGASGQNSLNANERGVLLSLTSRIFRRMDLSAFADLSGFPWLKYRVNAPSCGAEAGILATFGLSPSLGLSARYTYCRGALNGSGGPEPVHPLEEVSSSATRLVLTWGISNALALKTLFGTKAATTGGISEGRGYLLSQALTCSILRSRAGLSLSYTLFDIPSYTLRICVHEPDVLYSLSVPAFQGRGIRVMARGSIEAGRHIEVWVWGGMTWYDDRASIGTGNEMISGNTVSEVKIQLRLRR
jgi:DNA uptake protein ComE-like DNA-binding protein